MLDNFNPSCFSGDTLRQGVDHCRYRMPPIRLHSSDFLTILLAYSRGVPFFLVILFVHTALRLRICTGVRYLDAFVLTFSALRSRIKENWRHRKP